ncbi:serine/threonine-protein kinase [Mycolicibacterium gadium]|uniref:non-specific serine/threonine protein kinase n=1 Tax=Mycolicibacterium gadium TaxID=1794 RepID=A0ABT6GIS2_MYCGU|nr:serine/threonine-protein kinase [Mycolicibacterium gadium]MDG5481246.1 serine/threonine protein kinase [Mycolicibacterium gadium]
MPVADGAVFAGYTIVRLLGVGGMGEVYLVRHPRLPRLEALKILPEDVSADPEFRQRFAREADIAASLWHPHVVAVHDRGEHEGQLWIAMDYVEGTDAAQMVRNRFPRGMPPKDALEIVSAIADALDYAHERYLLHRDVKPANILLTNSRTADRRILLADFGIAKAANETHGITATNIAVGTVAYAAPEQLTGSKIDGRADQYALACTAFHLLTGRQPFASSNPAAVIGSHLSSPPPRLGELRADLRSMDNALARAMAKEPYQRFDTCREFVTALTQSDDTVWGGAIPETQHRVPPAPLPPLPPRRVEQYPEPQDRTGATSRTAPTAWTAAMVGIGIAALIAVGMVAFLGARLAQSPSPSQTTPTASPPEPTWPRETTQRSAQQETVTETVTKPDAPAPVPPPPPRPSPRGPGDLGLPTPISNPACNGQWIAVLGSVTTPGKYQSGVQALLDQHPGASYLRTDQSCPSLRQADEKGDPIYAVYRPAGATVGAACAIVRSTGGGAYAKVLDRFTPAERLVSC